MKKATFPAVPGETDPRSSVFRNLEESAKIGWWSANYTRKEFCCSGYLQQLLGLEENPTSWENFRKGIHPDHKERVVKNFSIFPELGYYDEVFPVMTQYGYIWVHSKLGKKEVDGHGDIRAQGFMQVLDEMVVSPRKEESSHVQLKELLQRQNNISQSLLTFLRSSDTDQVIRTTLSDLRQQLDGDRVYIFEFDRKKVTHSCTYEVTKPGITPEIETLQNIPSEESSWWTSQLLNANPIFLNSMDELPEDAEMERETLSRQGIASLMAVPLLSKEGVRGYIGVDINEHPRMWTNADREWFQGISNIISICIELRKSEERAQQERQYFESLYRLMPMGYLRVRIVRDKEGEPVDYRFIDFNPAFESIIATKGCELLDQSARWTLRNNPLKFIDDMETLKEVLEKRTLVGKSSEFKGHYYQVISYVSETDEIVFLLSDTTEQVKASESIRRSEELLRNIYKNIPVGIEIYDKNGSLLDLNEIEAEIFGFAKKEDVLGVNLFENPAIPKHHLDKLRDGQNVSFELVYSFDAVRDVYYKSNRTGARNLTVNAVVLYNTLGEVENYLLIVIDNTETLKVHHRIEEFEVFFNSIAEFADVGFCRWNPMRQDFFGSEQWFKNLNQPSHTITHIVDAYEGIHPEDKRQLEEFFQKALRNEARDFKREIRVRDGRSWKWLRCTYRVKEFDPLNDNIEIIGLNINVTNMKEIEHNLLKAKQKAEESDRLKSAFLANMSHEIRTPLNAIVGFSNLLVEAADPDERQQYISVILQNNELLLQLISDILDLSKIEAGIIDIACGNVDLNPLCREIISAHSLKTGPNIQLIFDRHLPHCILYTDRNRLSQLLSNLIGNAIKFTQRGSIRVGYELDEKQDHIRFYVQDTGIGMSPKQCKSIFTRFVKLNSFIQGTGLGLAISKSIVEKLGGEIGVESEEGKGSRFWFTLPYHPVSETDLPAETETPVTTAEPQKSQKSKERPTILIAEDTESNFILISTILKREYNLIWAQNGRQAVEFCEAQAPDLILMDIKMPEMDGLEATRTIRSKGISVPIIAATAFAYDSDREEALQAGCNDYLSKPLSQAAVKEMILKYL